MVHDYPAPTALHSVAMVLRPSMIKQVWQTKLVLEAGPLHVEILTIVSDSSAEHHCDAASSDGAAGASDAGVRGGATACARSPASSPPAASSHGASSGCLVPTSCRECFKSVHILRASMKFENQLIDWIKNVDQKCVKGIQI